MKVRAKFWVQNINHHHVSAPGEVFATLTMAPVYDDKNKDWSKATPQGKIEMSITNPGAIEQFELGKQYYVDFTPAE
jgi:hypothetical protein